MTNKEAATRLKSIKGLYESMFTCEQGDLSIQAVDMAIAVLEKQNGEPCEYCKSGWISVDDRLPDSGDNALLCCEMRPSGQRYICDGYYAKPKSITSGCNDECASEYDEESDEYFLLEGYYEVIKNWEEFSSVVIDDFVTHWMPLPKLPKGE